MKQIFDLDKGMTQAISHFSRHQDAGKETVPETGKYRYTGKGEGSAEDKIRSFYERTRWFLWLGAAAFLLVTNVEAIDKFTKVGLSKATPPAAVTTAPPPSEGGKPQ
jgi:hypothetical protein